MKRKVTRMLIGIVIVAVVVSGGNIVRAFVVQNPIWDLGGSNYVTYKASELSSSMQDRFSDARATWNNVPGSNLFFLRNDASYKLRAFTGYIDGTGIILAVTNRYWPWDTYISSATVKLDQDEYWYTGTGTPGINEYDSWSVFTHELGHAVGIQHTNLSCSGSDRPTMCGSIDKQDVFFRSLEKDDQDAIEWLY